MKTSKIISFFLLLLIGQISCKQEEIQFREIFTPHKSVSPAISILLDTNNVSEQLGLFWNRIENEGAPLIEPDLYDDDYIQVTFVWRETSENQTIALEFFGIYEEYRLGDMKLHRLKDTDLFYRCYAFPKDICFSYRFIVTDTVSGQTQKITDPFNQNLTPTGERNKYSWSILDLRPEEPDWYTKRYENTGSRLDTFKITSNFMSNTRNIYVYLPPGYDSNTRNYPVMYLFDSFIYLNRVEVPNVLDNMIHENRIEPMIAIFIDNPTSTSRLTELPLNPQFKAFMTDELIPEINTRYRISNKREDTMIGGISYGGLAASYIGFECDSIFGNILSQSGSYWRGLEWYDINGIDLRGDWLINRYLTENKKDLKLFLDWGLQENWCLSSGRRMVRVLDKKGYQYKFTEFNGWHDWSNSRKTFPVGLLYLMGKE